MRVFLKSRKTGHYYSHSGQLDAECTRAMEFPSVPAATRHAVAANLAEVEIVLRCDYLSQEVFLPVVPEWGDMHDSLTRQITSLPPTYAPASAVVSLV